MIYILDNKLLNSFVCEFLLSVNFFDICCLLSLFDR